MPLRPVLIAGLLLAAASLTGCETTGSGTPVASDGSLPASGEFSGHVTATGGVTRSPDGRTTFMVRTAAGVQCTADISGVDSSLTAPVTCSDGHNGQGVVNRRHDGTSGTVILVLDNGTRGRFVFGDLTLGQAFEDSGSAALQ